MPRSVKLLSKDELLAEEAAIKKKLSDLDSTQRDMPHSSFIAKREYLDKQLEMVLSELSCRERP
jgi:hypothetical protein